MVLQFFLGFIASFIASLPPGLLNLTSLKITLEKGKRKSYHFALGVSLIILFQSYFSLALLKYLNPKTETGAFVQVIGVFVFAILSIFFFYSFFKEKKAIEKKPSKIKNTFYFGLLLSSINVLGIPYYCGVGSTLNAHGLLDFSQLSISAFVMGTAFGTFSLLSIYIVSAIKIEKKIGIISRNSNFILGLITLLVAILTLIQIL